EHFDIGNLSGHPNSVIVNWRYTGSVFSSDFEGTGLTDSFRTLTGGTVTRYVEYSGAYPGSRNQQWGVENLAIPAVNLQQVMQTPTTDDDYALIQSVMAGDDTISGSPYNDVLYGYGGDDR